MVIGFTFDADNWCVLCTHQAGMDAEDARDREGNPVHAIFGTDEQLENIFCGNCGEWIAGPGSGDGLADAVAEWYAENPPPAADPAVQAAVRRALARREELADQTNKGS